jgi:hypothetical protein
MRITADKIAEYSVTWPELKDLAGDLALAIEQQGQRQFKVKHIASCIAMLRNPQSPLLAREDWEDLYDETRSALNRLSLAGLLDKERVHMWSLYRARD